MALWRSVLCHSEQQAIEAVQAAETTMSEYRCKPEQFKRIGDYLRMNAGRLG